MKKTITFLILLFSLNLQAQNYTSYFTGSNTDFVTTPDGGICLMGGATESDAAMQWLLQKANGGDVLVLRASGSDGYNNYLYSQLGISVNSVETIVFHHATASNETYIHQRIAQAELIWFAGGDQWDYVSYWRGTAIDSLINDGLVNRNIAIGGTSAGMAILGHWYFSAENGGLTSNTALANPYYSSVQVDTLPFLQTNFLKNTITDTHYDDRARKGRHMTFLARARTDWGIEGRGIACDEYTALCIDTNGIAIAFGEYPTYDDNVYFLQVNCENINSIPENCTSGQALNWNLGGDAVKVYHIKGTLNGSQSFDLNDWTNGVGGTWEDWYVDNGVFQEMGGSAINCVSVNDFEPINQSKVLISNPILDGYLNIYSEKSSQELTIINVNGQVIKSILLSGVGEKQVNVSEIKAGIYFLKIKEINATRTFKIILLD